MGMPVALDDLRGRGCRSKVQFPRDLFFDVGRKMRECPDRAGKFPDAHGFDSFFESRLLPFHFVMETRQFESESRWLGVDAMGPADNHGSLEFMSAFLQHIEQPLKIFKNDC